MRRTILVSVAALLVVGTLQGEALAKIFQRQTVSDTLVPWLASDSKSRAHGWSARRDNSVGRHASKIQASAEPPEEPLDEEFEEGFEPSEGSRSVGGAPAGSPPDWLIGSWYQPRFPGDDYVVSFDDRFAGFLVRLNGIRLLTYEKTCREPQKHATRVVCAGKETAHEQLSFGLKPNINAETGPKGTRRLFGCDADHGKSLEGGMGVFSLTLAKGSESLKALPKLKTKPPLQSNPNVKDNCFLYSYSGSSDPLGEPDRNRTFTKFKVFFMECSVGICRFSEARHRPKPFPHGSEEAGAICRSLGDAAAPILCGADQKLSFLTIPLLESGRRQCDNEFYALSIAYHYSTLLTYVDKEEKPEIPKN